MQEMIARYKILDRLGAGGMGEVYRALDTKMRREVALKLLPPQFVKDADRVARFKQEALATSALNHPNITTIFEIDEADGKHFICLEFIAGRSLREMLRSDAPDLRQILDFAAQVAEGLHAAHEAGVVHRDLKPENLMVRPDGVAKILDFGLAKLGGGHEMPSPSAETLIQQPSPGNEGLTQPGMVLGTVAYMSPEQARGQHVDHRSDIFTFGSIMVEMLTGKQPFQAPSSVEVMHAIIHEPPRLQSLGSGLPAELVRIVRKCMAKNPSERYQSAKDLAIDLRALLRDLDSGEVTATYPSQGGVPGIAPASGAVPEARISLPGSGMSSGWGTVGATPTSMATPLPPPSGPPGGTASGVSGVAPVPARRRLLGPLGLAVGVVALTAALALVFWGRRERGKPEVPAAPLQMTKLTNSGNAGAPAFAPKGQFIAYTYNDPTTDQVSIRIRQISTGTEAEIVPPRPDIALGNLAFTPDGEWLLYTTRQRTEAVRTLWQVSPIGGTPREVLRDLDSAPSFAPDGQRFVFQRSKTPRDVRFYTTTFGSSEEPKEVLAVPEEALGIGGPVWSPADEEIVYTQVDRGDLLHRKLMIRNLESGATRAVPGPRWMQLAGYGWTVDGKGLYVTGSKTWVDHLQISRIGLTDGSVHPVTQGFDEHSIIAMRRDGKALATVRTTVASQLWHVPMGGTPAANAAQARQITRGTTFVGSPRVSPDGTQISVVSEEGGHMDLWVMGVDGSNRRQLTFGAAQDFSQTWSPDGRRVAYASESEGDLQVWVTDADGKNAQQLTRVGNTNYAPSWSPDGKWIAFISSIEDSSILYKIRPEGGDAVRMSGSAKVMMLTEWSPDGNSVLTWLFPEKPSAQLEAGVFPASGAGELRRYPFLPRSQWSMLGLRWTPDSKNLSTIEQVDGTWSVRILPLDGSVPRVVVSFPGEDVLFNYGWSPDGRFLIAQRGTMNSDILLLENLP